MENRKFVKFLIPIFISGFFMFTNNASAYFVETHAYLTNEIFNFYNQSFQNNKIPDELKPYLIDGSRREDDIPRYLNHFYDPINNRGFTEPVFGTWQISRDWAKDSENQNKTKYKAPATVASILTAIEQRKISALSAESDFTWQKAINLYALGEKEKAMFTLGHILHLAEDLTVPDHTRNDPHVKKNPYEDYALKFNLSSSDKNLSERLKNKQPKINSDFNSYFDELAKYSNNNFYSADTIGIQSGYELPQPDYDAREDNYFYPTKTDGEFGDYKLFRKSLPDILLASKFDININVDPVMQGYWSRLSTKSVQYGAGLVNLFFQDVEKAKNEQDLAKIEDKSFLARAVDSFKNVASSINGYFSGLFGNNQNFQPAGAVQLNSQPNNAQTGTENTNPTLNTNQNTPPPTIKKQSASVINNLLDAIKPKIFEQKPDNQNEDLAEQLKDQKPQTEEEKPNDQIITPPQTTNFKECSFNTSQSPSRQKIIINEVAWMGGTASANDEWIELKNISGGEVDLTNWQLLDKDEQIKINLGSINGTKLGADQFVLLERTDDNSVPNISANFIYSGALSNTNDGLRLFDSGCNLIDEAVASSDWPAGNSAERKTMERNRNDFNWHTSANVNGTPKKENSEPVIYGGGGGSGSSGNTSNNSNNNASISGSADNQPPKKILITEIQITGGTGKTENDFIELYNPNDSTVNLNGYRLVKRTKTGTTDTSIKSWTTDISISANSYYLWANSSYTDIPTTPDITTTATISDDNGVAIRFGSADTGTIIDSVGWGEAQNAFVENSVFPTNPSANQSIQRKFQNNNFIDTDNNSNDFEIQNCPSPKAQSGSCKMAAVEAPNQAPSAFFVYTPANPIADDSILFDASSSTDFDGQIISYEWNFDDGQKTSSTTAAANHTYSSEGNYEIQLIVLDDKNASSGIFSKNIFIESQKQAGHIVISEIQTGTSNDTDNEFVELYNPTYKNIDISNWSLKRKTSRAATSTKNLVLKFPATSTIAAKSFFLIAHNNYNGKTSPDIRYSNNSNPLAYDDDSVILENSDGLIIDEVYYLEISEDKSFERKSVSRNQCASPQGENEFFGNGCDTDTAGDFEVRDIPNPQNYSSLPEPRSAPSAPQNFNIQYSSSTMKLNLIWEPPQGYENTTSTVYEIRKIDGASSTVATTTKLTNFTVAINEIGRDYNFLIKTADKDGLSSEIVSSIVSVPSFLSNLYFYKNASSTDHQVETYYSGFPFMPDVFGFVGWKKLVFYLNDDGTNKNENIFPIKYKHCTGGYISQENELILPDNSGHCGPYGGAYQYAMAFDQLEDNHFIIPTSDPTTHAKFNSANPEQNYLTATFYDANGTDTMDGTNPHFQFVATDKTKYYLNQLPKRAPEPPQLSGEITVSFDKSTSKLNINWPKATDPDTLDGLLKYEIQYTPSGEWQNLNSANSTTKIVAPGESLSINVRAEDDFGNYSDTLIANWSYPETNFYIIQDEINGWSGFGGKNWWTGYVDTALQSLKPETDFQFNRVVMRFNQSPAVDVTGLKLSIYSDNNNRPNFSNQIGAADLSLYEPDKNHDVVFSFSNPISVSANNKYWLVLQLESYAWWLGWERNGWALAVSNNNPYPLGESANIPVSDSFNLHPNTDWYMKIGSEL